MKTLGVASGPISSVALWSEGMAATQANIVANAEDNIESSNRRYRGQPSDHVGGNTPYIFPAVVYSVKIPFTSDAHGCVLVAVVPEALYPGHLKEQGGGTPRAIGHTTLVVRAVGAGRHEIGTCTLAVVSSCTRLEHWLASMRLRLLASRRASAVARPTARTGHGLPLRGQLLARGGGGGGGGGGGALAAAALLLGLHLLLARCLRRLGGILPHRLDHRPRLARRSLRCRELPPPPSCPRAPPPPPSPPAAPAAPPAAPRPPPAPHYSPASVTPHRAAPPPPPPPPPPPAPQPQGLRGLPPPLPPPTKPPPRPRPAPPQCQHHRPTPWLASSPRGLASPPPPPPPP
eukprot:scaffold54662_cov60-Phaeocystis_antarctica.AAC.1